MPSQKRPLSSTMDNHLDVDVDVDGDSEGDGNSDDPGLENHQIQKMIATVVEDEKLEEIVVEATVLQRYDDSRDSDEEDGGSSSSSSSKDEYFEVKLADIRKEVQCPICLGIIRKTRTVMECLHRFCRECIDKSMRLGNNECPACRTHCASRRSLRDDPKYDALIAALYPDIDKYEEEELTFHEEETNRNKKIQASIAETLRRQTEALGKRRVAPKVTAAVFMRKSRRSRNKSFTRDSGGHGSDNDDDEDADDNNGGKDFSSADERCQDARSKRPRRLPGARLSPALGASNSDGGYAENEDTGGRELRGASPGKAGNREVLVWGKGGVRSQTRHGSGSSANGKNVKGNRITRLVDYFRNLDEKEDEFDLHLTLVPMDKDKVPGLERPYLCCRPTLSVKHICHFIALQTSIHAEQIEILVRKPWNVTLAPDSSSSLGDTIPKGQNDILENELQILEAQESLSRLHAFSSSSPGNLVLIYRAKN